MKKPIIISCCVDGRDKYSEIVKPLEASIDKFWDGDVMIYKEFPEWCTSHSKVPYKFKFDMIQHALEEGYTQILWMDSTMRLLMHPLFLLKESKSGLVVFDNLGHPVKNYINDNALNIMLLKSEDIEGWKQIWGGLVFWDLKKQIAKDIFDDMRILIEAGAMMEDNTTRHGFVAHRHEQAVLSILVHNYNVELLPYGIVAARKHVTNKTVIQYGN